MPGSSKSSFAVTLCNLLIGVAAQLVPRPQRQDWKQEWSGEIWHRRQFLVHAGVWSRREALRLVQNCWGALPDAFWHLALQESVRGRMRNWARSPWTCLGSLAVLLLGLALITSGFPATRELLGSHSVPNEKQLLFIWLHPGIGGSDRGLPPDVAAAWASHSHLLQAVAPFNISKAQLVVPRSASPGPLVITTEPGLFQVLHAKPSLGDLPQASGVVLDHQTWQSAFCADPKVVGKQVKIGREWYRVASVLPAPFHFLTRQPSIYVVQPRLLDRRVLLVARANEGAQKRAMDKELTKIAEDVCYYFFKGQLRLSFFKSAALTPLAFFALAVLVCALFTLMMSGARLRHIRAALGRGKSQSAARRASFFVTKLTLGLMVIFTAGLEASRSQSAIVFASKDPANGPVLVWFYIVGTMGVFFWALADQRTRCRACLRLLCFPVRMGCPGCLLLDWSGTELLCTQGHGVLHVPYLAPSWDEEAEHWISLDESWRGLFAGGAK